MITPSALSICLVSSEAVPYAKSGGLADVATALTQALAEAGHDARLVLPFYGRVRKLGLDLEPVPSLQDIETKIGERRFVWSVSTTELSGASKAKAWFIRCPELFGGDELYTGDERDALRFLLLSRATIEMCQRLQWAPDVFHVNDWHAGLVPFLLESLYTWDKLFERTKTLLSIHNVGYQGTFPTSILGDLGLEDEKKYFYREDTEEGRFNFLKTGILYASALSTVSRTYAREIQSSSEHGMGLEELLAQRAENLFGIPNGVGPEWDPQTDPLLPANFSAKDLSGKAKCRKHLLEHFGLHDDERAPVVGIVSRLTQQKGFELLPDVLPIYLQRGWIRLCVLGSGEERYEEYFNWLIEAFPGRVGFHAGYDEALAHRIEAGSDMFLMPSRYEPCGLNQMYSQLYGCAPIVRRTGGLADTVEPFDAERGTGTGFLFDEFRPEALQDAMDRALTAYADREAWKAMILRGMKTDFSWKTRAADYVALYRRLQDPVQAT